MKFISREKHLAGKIILLRVDINENYVRGKILMGERIKEAASTISFLKKKGARVVILAHQGRPGQNDCTSLRMHSRLLSRLTKVIFVPDLFGKTAVHAIQKLKNGEAVLLENVRKYKEEYTEGKNALVETLSSLADYYVNDAFSNSHRDQTSMVALPKAMKGRSFAGPLLEKEVKALAHMHLKGALYVLGGAKPGDTIRLLGKNKTLVCGLFGQMCLIARGVKLGAQENYLRKTIRDYGAIVRVLKKKQKHVFAPLDFGVKVDKKGTRKNFAVGHFPSDYEIFDIGPETQDFFCAEIARAKAVYMKGPAGDFSSKGFSQGTFALLRAVAESKAFTIIGGGHLSDARALSKISKKKFNHVSLSGGALLRYLAGEKLPGLEVLNKR